ncbi:cytoadherence linked asexual protein 3.1, putative [Plasmodium sp. gorilla clade G3]|nr:cytoadherence linked asexual protein 3.1, putative [Plasmodium sp. gorilla clade G3]
MECNILEYLIHYFNKYQLEIIKTTEDTDFELHGMMEHKYIKDYFFSYMCNDPKECIIYHTNQFKKEANEENSFPETETHHKISAYNLYLNYYYFMKRYSSYGTKKILYVHLLNLTGLLNHDTKAYVTSLYLPGYYNAVEMSFTEEKEFTKIFEKLLQCIDKCHDDQPYTLSKDSNLLNDITKCDMCRGTFLYSNIISYHMILIGTRSYFCFGLQVSKILRTKNIAEAMYLNIKDEDTFNKTLVTKLLVPFPIKKIYTIYVRNHIPNNLVDGKT